MGSGEGSTTTDSPPVRIVLVGFMASGKTSVGRCLAGLLGWTFRDFDDEIESEAGSSVPEIFAREGESFFRELEERVGRRLLPMEEVVLATGGGWAVPEGRLTGLPRGTLSVWLRISPETAIRRARDQNLTRPLLDVDDPLDRARTLLAEREPSYRKATLTLDAEEEAPDELARIIAEQVRSAQETAEGVKPPE